MSGKRDGKSFKTGKFKIKSVANAIICLDLDRKMTPYMENKGYKNVYMQRAISKFVYDGHDADRLVMKMGSMKKLIPQYGSLKLTLLAIEDIYNFRCQSRVRIY